MKQLEDKFIIGKFSKHLVPFTTVIELTDDCFYDCFHCKIIKSNNYLDYNLLKKTILELKQLGTFTITLSGGEPFLYNKIFDLIKFIKKQGFELKIISNGYLLDKKKILKLKELKIDEIQISLHTLSEKKYRKIMFNEKNCLNKILENLKLLKKYKINTSINYNICVLNKNEYKKFIDFAEKNRIGINIDYRLFPKKGKIKLGHLWVGDNFIKRLEKLSDNEERQAGLCNAGKNQMFISADANIYPCSLYKIKLGNIKKNSIIDIWKKSKRIKKLRALKLENFKKCYKCMYKKYCSICLGFFYDYKRDFNSPPEILCRIAKQRYSIFEK